MTNQTQALARELERRGEQLRTAENRFRAMLEALGDAVLIVDMRGMVLFVNTATEALYRRRAPGLIGKPLGFSLPARQACEVAIPLDNGTARVARMQSVRTEWEGRQAYVVTLQDVTGRQQLEATLRETQRMALIGQLAGGVAHDFNNLVQAIQTHCEAIARRPQDVARVRESVDGIRRVCNRAAPLVDCLLAYQQRRGGRPLIADLNEIVSQMGAFIRRLIGPKVRVETQACARDAPVRIDPTRVEQVLLNLAVNARDAMPEGGTLRIAVERLDAERDSGLKPGNYVVLTVSDEGCGVDAATRARMFDPFFSTKRAGKGTGVGLSTVREIVEENGGVIRVDSRPAAGTTFRIFLPRAEELTAATPDAARGVPEIGAVLLVEDEPEILEFIAEVLEPYAQRVLCARDAAEALQTAASYDRQIDLLITDLSLPCTAGRELAAQLQRARADLRVIFISGEAPVPDASEDSAGDAEYTAFVAKPFTRDDLLAAIGRVFEGAGAAS